MSEGAEDLDSELRRIVHKNGKCLGTDMGDCDAVIEGILSWHESHRSEARVTREQLEEIVQDRVKRFTGNYVVQTTELVDDIFSLLNGQEKRVWCEHIKWDGDCWQWTMVGWRTPMHIYADICPVAGCHKERPRD